MSIAVLSDAHLLMQAEWIEDEIQIAKEGEEVLENFHKAIDQVIRDSPEAVILAGDMFDYKTKSGQRVTHREGEKYMLKIRDIISMLVADLKCRVYALKGNHDSKPILRSLEKTMKEKFFYVGNKSININGLNIFLLDSNYTQGPYEISLENLPLSGDLLIMHESIPLWGVQGINIQILSELSKRFNLVLNSHMHVFYPKALGLHNFYLLPALIPSREIKGNWTIKYRYPEGEEPEIRETPFGYVMIEDEKVRFVPYEPLQKIVRVEIRGSKAEEFLQGIRTIYDLLMERSDRELIRVWIETNADPLMIDKIIRPEIATYREIHTVDIIRVKERLQPTEEVPSPEFENKAFTLDELTDRVLSELKGSHKEIASELFEKIFTREILLSRKIEESLLFKQLLEIMATRYKVSPAFVARAWDLAKER